MLKKIQLLRSENKEYKILYNNVLANSTFLENEWKKKLEATTLLSTTDYLTNICNRKKLTESILIEIERKKRHEADLSLAMFDVDNFKEVNDQAGHAQGDIVLIEIAKLVTSQIRLTDIFGRMGGDEFLIIFPNTDASVALKIIERIRLKIELKFRDYPVQVTCSFGIVIFEKNDSFKNILKRVDHAMYQAKEKGRNKIIYLKEAT